MSGTHERTRSSERILAKSGYKEEWDRYKIGPKGPILLRGYYIT